MLKEPRPGGRSQSWHARTVQRADADGGAKYGRLDVSERALNDRGRSALDAAPITLDNQRIKAVSTEVVKPWLAVGRGAAARGFRRQKAVL